MKQNNVQLEGSVPQINLFILCISGNRQLPVAPVPPETHKQTQIHALILTEA